MAKLIEKYVAVVRLNRGIATAYPITVQGVTSGTSVVLASTATPTIATSSSVIIHTPTQNETINFPATGSIGQELFLEVLTSGTTSFTLTFGANVRSQGVLATGIVSASIFIVAFVFDGTRFVETGRTTVQ